MSNKKQLTADELADMVNKHLDNSDIKDKRFSTLTKRRILDYTTKGLLQKPFKNGNKNYYTEEHFNQLISLRDLQGSAGMSDKTLLKAVASAPSMINKSEEDYKTKASDILRSLREEDENQKTNKVATRVLQNIGTEYITSSSLNDQNNKATANSGLAQNLGQIQGNFGVTSSENYAKISEFFDFDNQEMILEDNQRNRQSVFIAELRHSFLTDDSIFEVVPGMKVIVDYSLQINVSDEEKIREFYEKLIKGFRKTTDGS